MLQLQEVFVFNHNFSSLIAMNSIVLCSIAMNSIVGSVNVIKARIMNSEVVCTYITALKLR